MFWENYCQSFKGGKAIVDPTVYRIAKVDPMHFGRTKVDPLVVGELLSIQQCIRELGWFLCVSRELRLIFWR